MGHIRGSSRIVTLRDIASSRPPSAGGFGALVDIQDLVMVLTTITRKEDKDESWFAGGERR
jgi:hypothetical protein